MQRRRRMLALLDQFEGLAHRQPILFSFEDALFSAVPTGPAMSVIGGKPENICSG
jgi:hypothetical protein